MDLQKLVIDKIAFGENLVKSIDKFSGIDGTEKLVRKIKQEIKFLKRILLSSSYKKEHLQCSNLTHFSALINSLANVKNCVSVNKAFMLEDRKITIDNVCDNGFTWKKVIARNPKSISQVCMGDSSYGVRSVIDQADDYIKCSKLYPCMFKIPVVVFLFAYGVDDCVADKLKSFGIIVESNETTESYSDNNVDIATNKAACQLENPKSINAELSSPNISNIAKLNLDVSTMLAYVSSVTNGSAHLYDFPVQVLAQQAEWERQRPVKQMLDEFFASKRLYCCETAKNSFLEIVNTVGGPNEKVRANELMDRLTVLPDCAVKNNEDNVDVSPIQFLPNKSLPLGGKIRERSLKIFTFGDRIGAVTVTSNDGFVRSSKQQGVNFVVFVHESRALTEQKEQLKGVLNK